MEVSLFEKNSTMSHEKQLSFSDAHTHNLPEINSDMLSGKFCLAFCWMRIPLTNGSMAHT